MPSAITIQFWKSSTGKRFARIPEMPLLSTDVLRPQRKRAFYRGTFRGKDFFSGMALCSERNASIMAAASLGCVTIKRCPSSIRRNLAFGISCAKMWPLITGTSGSSLPIKTSVGCGNDQSHGRLVHPVIARS